MSTSITDQAVRLIVEYSFFANHIEYHAFLVGVLVAIICFVIYWLDERISAITISIAVLAALGVIPATQLTPVVNSKPWYFLGGLVMQLAIAFIIRSFIDLEEVTGESVSER